MNSPVKREELSLTGVFPRQQRWSARQYNSFNNDSKEGEVTGDAGRWQRKNRYNTGDRKEEMMVLELIACWERKEMVVLVLRNDQGDIRKGADELQGKPKVRVMGWWRYRTLTVTGKGRFAPNWNRGKEGVMIGNGVSWNKERRSEDEAWFSAWQWRWWWLPGREEMEGRWWWWFCKPKLMLVAGKVTGRRQ